jgi:hypothetical protein
VESVNVDGVGLTDYELKLDRFAAISLGYKFYFSSYGNFIFCDTPLAVISFVADEFPFGFF